MDNILFYITFSSASEAKNAAKSVIEEKLAACANILPKMTSIYEWEGKTEESEEVVLILKTKKGLEEQLITHIKDLHSYDCPCIVSLPIEGGNKDFLEWINNNTK